MNRLILKKDTVPNIYPANVNMTSPLLITSATVSASMRPVVQKRKAHRLYPDTQTIPNIGLIH